MGKYKIIVDTGADMPEELARKYDIDIIRFMSVFGEESYVTGTELNNEQFYEKLKSYDGIPTTAQTPYADFYETLKKAQVIEPSAFRPDKIYLPQYILYELF